MRKSSLVKALACFMAATMAVTCVPGANVVNGVKVAQAALGEDIITGAVTDQPVTIEPGTGWYGPFSDYYQLTGDFNVTFTLKTDKNNTDVYQGPYIMFSSDANRGAADY